MKRSRKNSLHLGHRLLVLFSQESDSSGRVRNSWENLGVFPSRQLAYAHAKKARPGKKAHVEGVRVDMSQVQSFRRSEE